jgi:cystathionine gamma-synthase
MSAVILTLLTYMRPDGHIIFTSDCYRQTRDFAQNTLSKFGIAVSMVDPSAEAIEKAIRPNTNIIFTEAPTNPYLRVIDLAGVVKVAKKHKIMTIIDATLASPYNLKPIDMGIDVVLHSATKYFGGHNDLLAGVSMGRHDIMNDLYRMQRMIGAVPGPFTCFLLERGLKTFGLRMEHHNTAGLAVARMLESHPKVEKVWYPGLPSHPDHAVAKKQMKGYGSVITFLVKGGDRKRGSSSIPSSCS